MNTSARVTRSAPLLVVVAAAAVVVARTLATIIGSSTVRLIHDLVSDDGFYYFSLARHFPHPEVTPGILTTGFHPLYWLLLAGPFRLLGHTAAVRAGLALLLGAHIAIGVAIFVLVNRSRLGPWPAALTAAGWMASPVLRQISLSGVEVPLVVFFVVLASAVLVDGRPTPRRWAVAGILAGFAVLARVDAVVVVGVVALERFVTWWRASATRKAAVSSLATFAAGAVAVTSPWAVWLALHGGVPDSARALRVLRDHGVQVGKTGVGEVAGQLARFLAGAAVPGAQPRGALRAAAGIVILLLVLAGARSSTTRQWYGRWRGLLLGTALLYTLYATALGGIREWYQLYAAAAIWLVVLPPGIAAVGDALRSRGTAACAVAAALGVAVVLALAASTAGPLFPQEADKYLATQVAPLHVPPGATAGAFNSGVYTYFLPRRVVNLDGVVNPTVQSAIDHRRLCEYLRARGVGWFLDSRKSLDLLRSFAPRVKIEETFDLSAEYRRRDPYGVLDDQILARLDTSAC